MPSITSSPTSLLVSFLLPALVSSATAALSLAPIGRYNTNSFSSGGANPTAAEVPAYDPISQRCFVINGVAGTIDVLDLSNPASISKIASIPTTGLNPNSVAIRNGVVAVALADSTNNGVVQFFNAAASVASLNSGTPLTSQAVGAVPDMLTFTPDGTRLLVANEGEPSNGYGGTTVDPEGSISIINVSFPSVGAVTLGAVSTAGFTSFNSQINALRASGVRIFGPGATVAQDLEPEFIAISADSTKAYITLQENNAIATVDIATGTVEKINPLGKKDHSLPGNGFDGSRTDNGTGGTGINITPRQVSSFYAPDAVVSFQSGGQTYLFTANEGDTRSYPANATTGAVAFNEETTVGAVTLDTTAFSAATIAALQGASPSTTAVRNLVITNQNGQLEADADTAYEEVIMVGSRSFSTWIANPDGSVTLGYDSGDTLEQISATLYSSNFNVTNSSNTLDNRSTSKGPEPEGAVVGMVGATPILFVGNERQSNILLYDITDPLNPVFLNSFSGRDFTTTPGANTAGGDIGPEGLTFVPASDSPTGDPLLIVTYENSGSTVVFKVTAGQPIPEASTFLLTLCTALPFLRRRRP